MSEQRMDGKLFVLIEGRWFAIADTLVGEVDAFVRSLPISIGAIEDALPDETEPVYNKRMANAHSEELLLLDAKIKRPGGASTGIEFCDLLSSSGEIIHVKRKSRSSTLSHLFAQGSVSASTLVSDGEYRDALRSAISSAAPSGLEQRWLDLVPDSSTSVDKSKYTVCFVVLIKGTHEGVDWLPFFSRLNLMQHGRQLKMLGFDVAIAALSN